MYFENEEVWLSVSSMVSISVQVWYRMKKSRIRLIVYSYSLLFEAWFQVWALCHTYPCLNPIPRGGGGGGGQFDPPTVRNLWVPRDHRKSGHAFLWVFFFKVLRVFWHQVNENRTIGREIMWCFVLARRHKIYLCTKSVYSVFRAIYIISYILKINQDQIAKNTTIIKILKYIKNKNIKIHTKLTKQ